MKHRNLLFRIAKEELVEGVKEVVQIKAINSHEKTYKITVKVEDQKTYLVYATIKLTREDDYQWKLLDLSWEEIKA